MFLFIMGLVAVAFHAYNMGWQSGHDVHHDDKEHGPNPPRPPKKMWE